MPKAKAKQRTGSDSVVVVVVPFSLVDFSKGAP